MKLGFCVPYNDVLKKNGIKFTEALRALFSEEIINNAKDAGSKISHEDSCGRPFI